MYIPPQCSTESTIHDLYAWLKAEPELDTRGTKINKANSNIALTISCFLIFLAQFIILSLFIIAFTFIFLVNKKCINTRTFTRPKKRSARLSFESIFEGLPPSPSSDIWKPQNTDVTQTEDVGETY